MNVAKLFYKLINELLYYKEEHKLRLCIFMELK